jgi:hypothetical protein
MKNIYIAVLAVIVPLFAGCGGNKVVVGNPDQFVKATPFTALPEEADGSIIAGIGSSPSRASYTLMRDAALTSAQADLARKVKSSVSGVWSRTVADWAEAKAAKFDEAMSVEEMKTMQKSVADEDLRGPWQTQELVDQATGRYWVRILYSNASVEKHLKQRLQSEAVLKKYVIESQIKKVQDELQKDLDYARQREVSDRAKIAAALAK